MKFSFNFMEENKPANSENKTYMRPSHFYKKQEDSDQNKGFFLTSTNAEHLNEQKKLKTREEKSKSLHERLVTFEITASKSRIIDDPHEISELIPLEIPIFYEETKPNNQSSSYYEDKKKDFNRKKYKRLIKKLNFLEENDSKYKYISNGIRPFIFFFKYLAQTNITDENLECLKLNLPDTIIINEDDLSPMWLYTSKSGFVHKTENFVLKDILEKIGIVNSPDELVAVLKKPHYENQNIIGNDLKMFSTRDLNLWCNGFLLGRRGEMNVLQRFVKPKGRRAFINRTIWKRDGKHSVWIITNNINFNNEDINCLEQNKYCTNINKLNSCSIINIKKGKTLEDTLPFLYNIVKYFERHKCLKFDEIIGDFIKDENEVWWLINIKGFVLNNPDYLNNEKYMNYLLDFKNTREPSLPPKKEKYRLLKKCKYCEISFDKLELTHTITKRMIIQIDLHLINRGKDFEWLERSINLPNLTSEILCKEHLICDSCYHLYKSLEHLIKFEHSFAHLCGIKTSKENTFYNKNISLAAFGQNKKIRSKSWNLFINNKLQKNLKAYPMPDDWAFNIEPLTEVMILDNEPRKFGDINKNGVVQNYLDRYRFIIFLAGIDEIPLEYQIYNNYYLKFSLFEQTLKYKLDFSKGKETNKGFAINLNKLKVFYFYSAGKQEVRNFLKKQQCLTIDVFQEDKIIGSVHFQLNEFLNDLVVKREFYKFVESRFKESQINKILNCGFDLAIGLYQGPYINVNHIKLKEHSGIYLPEKDDYYTCDPFPDEWFNMLKEKKKAMNKSFEEKQEKSCEEFERRTEEIMVEEQEKKEQLMTEEQENTEKKTYTLEENNEEQIQMVQEAKEEQMIKGKEEETLL